LSPAAPALNRDRLLYEAGRRAARQRPWWPAAAGLFAMLSAGLGVRLATAPLPPPQIREVYVERDSTPEKPQVADATPSPANVVLVTPRSAGAAYLRLRDQVVRFGADSLPAVAPAAATPSLAVEQLLGLPFGTLDDANKSRWQHQLSGGDV
jgi:hypothetical protein